MNLPPRRLHPLSPLLSWGIGLLRSWPIVLLAFARSTWVLLVVLAVAIVVYQVASWARTTWSVDSEGLVVRSGILWRNVQTVPPQRVQQVEVRQALRHRATGLAAVRIGLAGGGGSSQVELDALSEADATALRSVLERWRRTASGAVEGPPSGHADGSDASVAAPIDVAPIVRVRTAQLVVAGLTSRSLWLAPLAAFAAAVQLLGDARLDDEASGAVRERLSQVSPAVTIAVLMVLALVAAAVTTVVSNYGLAVRREGGDVVVERGLLERRVAVVPRRRVQSVEVATNVVRDAFGLASLDVRTADLGGGGDSAGSTSVPIGSHDELVRLVGELLPGVDLVTEPDRHPSGAVRREIVRRGLRLVPLAVVVALVVGGRDLESFDATPVAVAAFAALVVAVVTGWIAGRRLRTAWTATAVVTERGAVVRRRWVVPVDRVQSVALSSDPFQRRLGLASLRLDVAGTPSGVLVRDLGATEAVALALLVRTAGGSEPQEPQRRPET